MAGLLESLISTKPALQKSSAVKVKQADLVLFTNQLSVMLSSGVVLSEGVEAIAAQAEPGTFQDMLFDISDKLQSGESFSKTLSIYPKVFDKMFISVIEASEASGQMPQMLDVLQEYLEQEADTTKQVKGALIYPAIMMVMAVVATATLLFFVLPKFTKIYESRGQALPKLTQMLVGFSKVMTDFKSASIMFAVFFAIAGGIFYMFTTPWGKRKFDYIKLHTPVLGTMFIDTIMTRSMRIIATTLGTGVPLLDALKIVETSCGNQYFDCFWAETCHRVEAGFQFSEAMLHASYSELISPAIIQMIKAGEKGGNLALVCEKVSGFYGKKLKSSIKNVTGMIEPLMIIVMGIIIGTIAIALLLPVFKISTVVSQ